MLFEFANPKMKRAVAIARNAATTNAPVLLTGEEGTGKRTLAAAIHDWSARSKRPLRVIPCISLHEASCRSELFGALEGDRDGDVLLEEVGDLSASVQAALAAVLKERAERIAAATDDETRISRIFATSARDLEARVAGGAFRADLLHLLDVVSIAIPPLRERREDVPVLTRHVLRERATSHERSAVELKPQAMAALASYDWPGNVRELVEVLERAAFACHGRRIRIEHLPDWLRYRRAN